MTAKIESICVEPLDLQLMAPFEISLGTRDQARNVLVSVRTDTGTVGYGEGSPLPPITGETRDATLKTVESAIDLLVGEPIGSFRELTQRLRASFPGMGAANFAVETALLDAYCRERNLPLSELFGGTPSTVTTDITIPIVNPERAEKTASEAVADGFKDIKIKTGSGLQDDIKRVRAVSAAAAGATLKIDANQGWTVRETVEFEARMRDAGIDIELIEQPVRADDIVGLRRIRDAIDVPIAADEAVFSPSDAIRIVREDAADIINVKLGKSGLLGTASIVDIAQGANIDVMIGCMLESSIGIHTSAHLVSGIGGFSYVDLDGNLLLNEDIVQRQYGPQIRIEGPGHGITPKK